MRYNQVIEVVGDKRKDTYGVDEMLTYLHHLGIKTVFTPKVNTVAVAFEDTGQRIGHLSDLQNYFGPFI